MSTTTVQNATIGKNYIFVGHNDSLNGKKLGFLSEKVNVFDSHQAGGREPHYILHFSNYPSLTLDWDEKLKECK